MLENLSTLMDIPDFRDKLITEFNTRNVIRIFRSKIIPKRSQASVNTGGVTEKKEESDSITAAKEEFNTSKKKAVKDWETAKEFAEKFEKIINETNKNLNLFSVPEVGTMLKEKNLRMCQGCMSSNCQLMQFLARKHKNPPKFVGKCNGKALTIGEMPTTIKDIESKLAYCKKRAEAGKKAPKKPTASNNAAAMEPKVSNYTNNTDEFWAGNMDLLEPRSPRQTHQTSARLCPVDISTLPEVTEETLPKWEDLNRYKIHSCYI